MVLHVRRTRASLVMAMIQPIFAGPFEPEKIAVNEWLPAKPRV